MVSRATQVLLRAQERVLLWMPLLERMRLRVQTQIKTWVVWVRVQTQIKTRVVRVWVRVQTQTRARVVRVRVRVQTQIKAKAARLVRERVWSCVLRAWTLIML